MEVLPIKQLYCTTTLDFREIVESEHANNLIKRAKERLARDITQEFHTFSDENRLYNILLGAIRYESIREIVHVGYHIQARASIYQEVD